MNIRETKEIPNSSGRYRIREFCGPERLRKLRAMALEHRQRWQEGRRFEMGEVRR